ncbi:hypothetical protein Tco_0461113 [Tanacetum coccineum]
MVRMVQKRRILKKIGWPVIGGGGGEGGGGGGGAGDGILGGASIGLSRKSLVGCGESVVLEEKGEEFCLDSKKDEVVPRVEDVPLVDGVLEGSFGGEGDDDFAKVKGWRKKLEWKPLIVLEEKKMKKMVERNEEGGDYLIKRGPSTGNDEYCPVFPVFQMCAEKEDNKGCCL